jgi:CRISPR-associated RAMP protein (TIGR02581 family)
MFDSFASRLVLRGSVHTQTGLHVGTGASSLDPSATDSRVIRDAAGLPFIPGSSFKGALRAHLESILRALKVRVCDPLTYACVTKAEIDQIKADAEARAVSKDGKRDRVLYDTLFSQMIVDASCAICRLFGSNYLAAQAMVKDLFVDPEWWAGRFEIRDGVGIDRDTETAHSGVKYDFEVVPASTRFELEIVVENAEPESMGLLWLGLSEMEMGRISLGGKGTRGLGGVKLIAHQVEVTGDLDANDYAGEGSVDLIDYLLNRRGRILSDPEMRKYLDQKTRAFVAAIKNGRNQSDA